MEQSNYSFSDRLRQSVSFILTVIGLTLFLLLVGMAISQIDNREQVEGKLKNRTIIKSFSARAETVSQPEDANFSSVAGKETVSTNQASGDHVKKKSGPGSDGRSAEMGAASQGKEKRVEAQSIRSEKSKKM